jgi:hypothetical protein
MKREGDILESDPPKRRRRPKGSLGGRRHVHLARPLNVHSLGTILAKIDRRTFSGKFVEQVRAELIEHVGPDPSPVQRMLIQRAAILSLRLAQIDRKILAGKDFTLFDNNSTIAWQNALTRVLVALGVHQEAARHGTSSAFDAVLAEIEGRDAGSGRVRKAATGR